MNVRKIYTTAQTWRIVWTLWGATNVAATKDTREMEIFVMVTKELLILLPLLNLLQSSDNFDNSSDKGVVVEK